MSPKEILAVERRERKARFRAKQWTRPQKMRREAFNKLVAETFGEDVPVEFQRMLSDDPKIEAKPWLTKKQLEFIKKARSE